MNPISKIRNYISVAKYSGMRNFINLAKEDSAELKIGSLAVALIVAVVVIVIAVSLIPTVFSSVYQANDNVTLVSKYSSAFDIVNLIPLIFAAVIIVVVLVLGFEKMGRE